MEASTSPNLFQLANFDKPMTTPAAFDRCPDARSGWRAGEILNLPSDNRTHYAVDVIGGGRTSAIMRKMSAKTSRGIATSAIWNET